MGLSGLEPPTSRLSGVRSNQLSYRPKVMFIMERVMGIEPTTSAWKAGVLPLNYTRIGNIKINQSQKHSRIGKTGFEPATPWSQTMCSTKLSYFPINMARPRGVEPLTS
jgi:hypothetical protein